MTPEQVSYTLFEKLSQFSTRAFAGDVFQPNSILISELTDNYPC